MEPDAVEIVPHVASSCSKTGTPIKATIQEVVVVEHHDMQNGGVLNNNITFNDKNKGKAISFDEQFAGSANDCYDTTNDNESYLGSSPISNSLLDPDSLIYEDDYECPDQYGYEMEDENDDYSMYQDLFDAKDIPTGVEVSMDWFPNSTAKEIAKSGGSSKSSCAKNGNKLDSSSSSSKKATKGSGIHFQNSFPDDALPHNCVGVIPPSAYPLPHNSVGVIPSSVYPLPHNSVGVIPSSAYPLPHNSVGVIPSSAYPLPHNSVGVIPLSAYALPHNSVGVIPFSAYALPQYNQAFHFSAPSFTYGSTTSSMIKYYPYHLQPQTPDTVMGEDTALGQPPASSGLLLPAPIEVSVSYQTRVEGVILAPDSSRVKRNMEDYLGTYLFFKRFDMVEDFSDHQYASRGKTSKQHSKDWVKRIQEEWRILEHDLPEMIFVRAYEGRMDLLRAVIIGAQGTPYHDGLFFFDIFFPDTYPSVPPTVYYHSGGLRINPNLYNCGKVCLSLLGTWGGSQKEKWIPNGSTMLQVLVSIQGLILNQKPYFNEPGYEGTAGSTVGESSSKAYSESTFLDSLKTMVYNMRRPPKYFEDFVYGHFFSCAHDVLKACKAYGNGTPVCSVVKGVVEDVEESSQSSSMRFRTDVAYFVETVLLKEFILLGVLGLEADGEEEDKPSETTESSSSRKSSSKRDRSSLS